jgi:3-hydroxyisobutyrate dehydrogenase-like beta-hydroxyacid dehydrogenase
MLVGGATSVYEGATARLALILPTQWYVGESESDAAAFKLMANSMLVNITEALAEFFDLANACGIDRLRAMSLFERFDPGRTVALRGPRMAKRDFNAAFHVSMAAKDARLMLEAAKAGGADMPAIGVALTKFAKLINAGDGGLDLGALAKD